MTPTPTPFLLAQIATDRGCLETGHNPVFAVGEPIGILYRVDAQIGGQPVPQAGVTIIDIPPGSGGMVIFSSTIAPGKTFVLNATVAPPTGIETVVIQAEANGFSGFSQAQCSFQVVQPTPVCTTACDCPTGQLCNAVGMCEVGTTPVYCCTHGPCPPFAVCQEPGGAFGTCPILPSP